MKILVSSTPMPRSSIMPAFIPKCSSDRYPTFTCCHFFRDFIILECKRSKCFSSASGLTGFKRLKNANIHHAFSYYMSKADFQRVLISNVLEYLRFLEAHYNYKRRK